jgi:hypothetical protein
MELALTEESQQALKKFDYGSYLESGGELPQPALNYAYPARPVAASDNTAESLANLWASKARPLSEAEYEAQRLWRGDSTQMSDLLRGRPWTGLKNDQGQVVRGGGYTEEEMRQAIEQLRRATQTNLSPTDSILYRNVAREPGLKPGRMGELSAANPESAIGKVIAEPSFTATSLSPEDFMYKRVGPNDMLLDIIHSKGQPGYPVLGRGEGEILLPPNMQYKVLGVKHIPFVNELNKKMGWAGAEGMVPNVLLQALGVTP